MKNVNKFELGSLCAPVKEPIDQLPKNLNDNSLLVMSKGDQTS